ncbi:DUF975 family protein [Lapidilactobacillus wuchangensis]|uniref:DUF975 family protein n=1 Tax=Lapidilactobacillus wuchangensis TaxID=2486001 RepID=UPI000F783F8F|nr:DUF975 family protein [Lapidilactobacillus wuchangensis]
MKQQYKTRAELKREVKDLYRGNWGMAIKLNLVPVIISILAAFVLIIVGIMGIISMSMATTDLSAADILFATSSVFTVIGSFFSSAIGGIIMVLISTGILFTSLNWLRTQQKPDGALKNAFAVFSGKYFVGTLLTYILVRIFTFLWTLLFIIPGIIKQYAYSQALYIFKDAADNDNNTNVSYFDCITKSRQLMVGHKWRLFVLQLSFIGWDILASLTFGIGNLWLTPYKNATYAAFYKDLVD